MNPRLGRAIFQVGLWLLLLSGVAVAWSPPGSAERMVAVASFGVAAVWVGIVVAVVRKSP
ncbi:hypothetical protein U7230_09185 [Carboxydochorda subterranea]|uniref:Uncharacterized protein n=1 Tax=Carboxydichorda subterranea TaxID=3109565 RepID=A0ABZ1BUB5_9FIRM|nr:hypothetical protein [Limnochorda sp. L945t]WRP16274.1 hypothetical protein U7230_09185 [Limnochorda sp. L945t]